MNEKIYYRKNDVISDKPFPESKELKAKIHGEEVRLYIDNLHGTTSIANLCEIGDVVNGVRVNDVQIGMGYCYCVILDEPALIKSEGRKSHILYSWQIDTIETPKRKYLIDRTNTKEYLVKEVKNNAE